MPSGWSQTVHQIIHIFYPFAHGQLSTPALSHVMVHQPSCHSIPEEKSSGSAIGLTTITSRRR
jgi:hypothetical protein